MQWAGRGSRAAWPRWGAECLALILAAWLQWEGGAALKSELPQSITLAESPYGCTDSKLEVAYMKDGRFYVFARDAS